MLTDSAARYSSSSAVTGRFVATSVTSVVSFLDEVVVRIIINHVTTTVVGQSQEFASGHSAKWIFAANSTVDSIHQCTASFAAKFAFNANSN